LLPLRQRGRDYALHQHGGERIAAEYASLIEEFAARHRTNSMQQAVGELGAILAETDATDRLVEPAARALHAALRTPLFAPQRIIVDVSHIAAHDHGTGIQRVVRSVVRWLYCTARPGVRVIAVRLEGS